MILFDLNDGYYYKGSRIYVEITETTFSDVYKMGKCIRIDLSCKDEEGKELNHCNVVYEQGSVNDREEINLMNIKKLIRYSKIYTKEQLMEQKLKDIEEDFK